RRSAEEDGAAGLDPLSETWLFLPYHGDAPTVGAQVAADALGEGIVSHDDGRRGSRHQRKADSAPRRSHLRRAGGQETAMAQICPLTVWRRSFRSRHFGGSGGATATKIATARPRHEMGGAALGLSPMGS